MGMVDISMVGVYNLQGTNSWVAETQPSGNWTERRVIYKLIFQQSMIKYTVVALYQLEVLRKPHRNNTYNPTEITSYN